MKKIINKIFGNLFIPKQYIITVMNVSGTIEKYGLTNKKLLKPTIENINNDPYWMVQKIEKIKTYSFVYKGLIKHGALHFQIDGKVTEMFNIENYPYSFLIKDKSLSNIERTITKENKIRDNFDCMVTEIKSQKNTDIINEHKKIQKLLKNK